MKKKLLHILLIALMLTSYACEKQQLEEKELNYLYGDWKLIELMNSNGTIVSADSHESRHPARMLTFGKDGQLIASQGGLCATNAQSTTRQSTTYTINSPLSIDCPINANCIPNILKIDACNQSLEVIFANGWMIIEYPDFNARYERAD